MGSMQACEAGPRRRSVLVSTVTLAVGLLSACTESTETLPLAPIPLVFKDKLLYAVGDILPTLDSRCTVTPEENPPFGSGSWALLVDTGTPLTALVPSQAASARQFPHGQISLSAARSDGSAAGTQFLRCDIPVVRSGQTVQDFRLRWADQPQRPLGGVIGGDQLSHFAMSLRFAGSPVSGESATLLLSRGDIATWCRIDRAVLPFRPVGGELSVELADTVITYPASRVTIGACVEPLANPLAEGAMTSCVTMNRVKDALTQVSDQLTKLSMASPRDEERITRLTSYQQTLRGLTDSGQCSDATETLLGDLSDELGLRESAYSVSGTNMRFLLATALPELVLTATACRRLTGKSCTCDAKDLVPLALPGLNSTRNDDGSFTEKPDYGCRISLGDAFHAALALVAKQRHLSPCDELARSRRQRYALRPVTASDLPQEQCLRSLCVRNLGRDPALLNRRCGYTGLDSDLACNDRLSPVASWIELGGPSPSGTTDKLEALVVPDSAAMIQSANADIRNLSAQVDGIIGVSVLRRLYSTIDYPQARLELSCRCGDASTACHAYRAVTYYTADTCVERDELVIPDNLGRTACQR